MIAACRRVRICAWQLHDCRIDTGNLHKRHLSACTFSYTRVYYFWESVSIARKFALLMLAVFIDTDVPTIKLLACLVVLLLGVIALFACKPFR